MSATKNELIIKQLMEFGLGEKESKVYLTLLELEVATVSEIALTSGVNRSSAYVVLESLKKKGLVSMSQGEKVERYIATSPEIFLRESEDRAIKTEVLKDRMGDILPVLKAMHKDTKNRPIVKVFEGKQGIISCFEDSLLNKEKIMRVCSSHEEWLRSDYDFREFFLEYIKKRHRLGIKMIGIHPNSEVAKHIMNISPMGLDEPILIPKEKYKFPAEIAVYDNKIGYISPEKRGFAIIIESNEMSDVMKNVFDLAFAEARRLNKGIRTKKKK